MKYSENLRNEPTKRTPLILMEPGKIVILGRSIPENPGDFYRPVFDWISKYVQNYIEKTNVVIGFEYINTSSIKWMYAILKEFSEIKEIERNACVTWYYEQGDEDISELGFMLRSLLDCPFFVVEVKDMNQETFDKVISELK
jgi:hypothetical protein